MGLIVRARPEPDAGAIGTTMRLAVLLSAGVAAVPAWRHLARDGDPFLASVAATAEVGGDLVAVLRGGGGVWLDVASVWAVATSVGAPLADTLRSAVAALRDAAEVRAEVTVALTEPTATGRLLSWLPLVGLPLGFLLGIDTFSVLVSDPLGLFCTFAGLALVGLARFWVGRLARQAAPPAGIPGWDAELLAVALSSGASIDRARALVAAHRSGARGESDAEVEATLDLSVRAGAPAVELLRGEAWVARQRARTRGREAAARLSTRLLLPLGICTLPAFLLLAVIPAVLGVLRSSVLPF